MVCAWDFFEKIDWFWPMVASARARNRVLEDGLELEEAAAAAALAGLAVADGAAGTPGTDELDAVLVSLVCYVALSILIM